VNVTSRVNRAVNVNVGGDGSSHATSSRQRVWVRQGARGTYESVESVEQTSRTSGGSQWGETAAEEPPGSTGSKPDDVGSGKGEGR
jgi:hypothetical protein